MLIFCASVSAEVKYIEVMDFSGGQVNSVINAKMQNNMGLIVKDYDIDELGHLHRRKGMTAVFSDAQSGYPIANIYAYQAPGKLKQIYLSRIVDNYFTNDTIINNVMLLTKCDLALNACTTYKYSPLYYPFRNKNIPFNSSYTTMTNQLIMASSYNPTLFSDGDIIWPQQPLAPGQPVAVALNGGGNLSATVRYKYCYLDKDTPDTSNLSTSSEPIEVIDGKVMVTNFDSSWHTDVDSILIYRELNSSQKWIYLTKYPNSGADTIHFLDTFPESYSGDTAAHIWGTNPAPNPGDSTYWFPHGNGIYLIPPPGACSLAYVDFGSGVLDGIDKIGALSECAIVGYSIVYVDTANKHSRPSALSYRPVDLYPLAVLDSTFRIYITHIPVPNNETIKSKILLRWIFAYPNSTSELQEKYYILDTLNPTDTLFPDVYTSTFMHTAARLYCESEYPQVPESTCILRDSALPFNPIDIVTFGSKLFAIGHPTYKNRLYFSDFYKPQKWPYDKFMEIPSIRGDWFVRLATIGQHIILFRQNSIVSFTGLSFYQYDIQTISNDIGITAYNSLIYGNQGIYFLHNTGFYRMNGDGGIQYPSLSLPIQNSLDSISNYNLVWADIIGDDIWLSVPIDTNVNNRTFIYNLTSGNWKSYDFGIKDGIMIDYDTTKYIYPTSKWIFIKNNDSLFRWNYFDNDTLDGSELIQAEYQSKYFLDDPDREKILYIDLIGSGICDSLRFVFYDNYGDSIGTKLLMPDFTTKQRQRVKVDHIVENFSFKIHDYGTGDYKILGYKIAYIPWGERKER
jgi:hypothetical protein